MRALLMGSAPFSRSRAKEVLSRLRRSARSSLLFIGVDGGVESLQRLGIHPHAAVGDWDSLKSKKSLAGIPSLTLPTDKDRSDLFFAAHAALSLGACELHCMGVIGIRGGRLDHEIATLLDLCELAGTRSRTLRSVQAYGESEEIHFLSTRIPRLKLQVQPGGLISVFALKEAAQGVTLTGFKYPLKCAVLPPSSRGLSNRAVLPQVRVALRRGNLVVLAPGGK